MKYGVLTAAAAAFFVAAPIAAQAQDAVATAHVNVRAGPGTNYQVLGQLSPGMPVHVSGCVRGYTWCSVQAGGVRGWTAASYLAGSQPRYRDRSFAHIAPSLGVGIIAGTVFSQLLDDDDRDRRRYHRRRGHNRHHFGGYGHRPGGQHQFRRGGPQYGYN